MPQEPLPPPLHVLVAPARLPAPLEALALLAARRHPFMRLAAAPGFRGRAWSFLACDPVEVLRKGRLVGSGALGRALEPLRAQRTVRRGPPLPFSGGWAGSIGYEARSGVEARPPPRPPPLGFPSLWLGRYDAVLAWDHHGGRSFVAGVGPGARAAGQAARRLLGRLRAGRGTRGDGGRPARPAPLLSPRAFQSLVRRTRAAVLAGEIFQANVSQRFDAPYRGGALGLFQRLVEGTPSPYMTFLDLGAGRAICSASPERFLRVVGRQVETDPMKGTRPRSRDPVEDRRLAADLERSEKERAELAMIVDLSRNDLARVCKAGSVRVVVPRRLLRFPRVHQAIGVVRGRLGPGRDRVDALAAAFPPGSVTGAPKVRAMEVIDRLEGEGRGPYCGALGWFDAGGDCDLAVAIRTILVAPGTASYRVGGGITLGSDPRAEWREGLDKGRGLYAALAQREAAP